MRLSKILRKIDGGLMFECPACDNYHLVYLDAPGRPHWTWNGDVDKPTFSPSLLVQYPTWVPPATTLEIRDKIKSGEIVQQKVDVVCHSFIRDGQFVYLNDCTHAMAGQTVDIPPLEGED